MENHHNGVNSTEELETLLSDYGVLFQEYRGNGFIVVGEENIFIVRDHKQKDDDGISFSEVNTNHIDELHAEQNRPSNRLDNKETATRVENGQNTKPTEIALYISNHTITFYTEAPIHKVAASFVTFRTDN